MELPAGGGEFAGRPAEQQSLLLQLSREQHGPASVDRDRQHRSAVILRDTVRPPFSVEPALDAGRKIGYPKAMLEPRTTPNEDAQR